MEETNYEEQPPPKRMRTEKGHGTVWYLKDCTISTPE